MRLLLRRFVTLGCAAGLSVASTLGQNTGGGGDEMKVKPPSWAYPLGASAPQAFRKEDGKPLQAEGSKLSYTRAEIADLMRVADWFPEAHPAMPGIVAKGRAPGVYACAYCHLPNGLGRPENASIAGLPVEYIVQQVADFKSGSRRSSEPRFASVNYMVALSHEVTADEVRVAAGYFSSLKATPWIRVVEADEVPKTRIAGMMLVLAESGGTEAIGQRVIEVPEDPEQTELRNARSGFVAYVPKGSLERGGALVKTGGDGMTLACGMCHGATLQGMGKAPSIAGRSPSQMARQMIDIKNGVRNGAGAALMKSVVAQLTMDDIVAITGYLASLKP